MTDTSRIDDLRRRVQEDPASIAFAQLAEEYRRVGRYQEAVDACHGGLALHPDYLSARVTLGRALLQLDRLDDAQTELLAVLQGSPQNLASIRGLAEIHRRRGALPLALTYYRAALLLTPDDPEIERTIREVSQLLDRALDARARDVALRTVAALDQWVAAIHVTRAQRRA